MRSFAIFLALIALALAGIAVFAYPAWELARSLGLDFRFHRVASRIAMLVLLAGFVILARRLRVADRASLGFALPPQRFVLEVARGMLIGALLMLPAVITMVLLDLREPKAGVLPGVEGWLKLILSGAMTGVAVALIEETFLRGAMQCAIARESGATLAIVLTSLLYAFCHFVSRFRVDAADVHPGSGFDMVGAVMVAFARPLDIADAFLSLVAVGMLLGMVRQLTGNIAACIGLHAAWVAVIFVVRQTSWHAHGPNAWLLSSYDGFVGWLMLGWTAVFGIVLYWCYGRRQWGRSRLVGDQPEQRVEARERIFEFQ